MKLNLGGIDRKELSTNLALILRRGLSTVRYLAGSAIALSAVRQPSARGRAGNLVIQGVSRSLSPVVKFEVSPPPGEMRVTAWSGQIPESEDQ